MTLTLAPPQFEKYILIGMIKLNKFFFNQITIRQSGEFLRIFKDLSRTPVHLFLVGRQLLAITDRQTDTQTRFFFARLDYKLRLRVVF